MFTRDIINTVLSYTDEVAPLDGGALARRGRILQLTQEVHDEIWLAREWRFTYDRLTTNLAFGSVGLPATFMELGESGGVWMPDRRCRLVEEFPAKVLDAREGGDTGLAHMFAIIGAVLWTNSTTASDDLVIWYRTTPEILVDDDLTPLTLPAAYHHSVLLQGVIARSRLSKGDMRDWENRYQQGLARMIATERRKKTSTQFMPMAVNNW